MSSDLAEIFSRRQRTGGIGVAPVQRQIMARPSECAALAAVFGLPGIAELAGDFTLTAGQGRGGGIIEAELSLRARITQICVVSLEPFDSVIREHAQLVFVPAARLGEDLEIAELNPDTLEDPDEIPYANESIDLGAVLAEQLALALPPYPRKPGVELPASATDSADNPFAGLAALRNRPANDPD